ncbi:DnaD domain protein [Oceanobacillus oncorhynchi]|uniref:DnaD domain-containing protein n=1 Tax=Oceanobacillus oncorhynchi TaxID=545501 RepID=UPI002F961A43
MKGYIKDYRQELHSDIWMMPPLYHRVWQFLKYKVNHKENKVPMRDGSYITLQPGQHLTSMRKIANQVGYYEQGAWKEPNPKTIKSILTWLQKQNMISVSNGDGNNKYTLITLLNWEVYQEKNEDGNSKYTVNTQSMDINKNDKNVKKEEEESPFKLFEENICMLNPINRESLIDWCEDLGDELIIAAIKLGAKYNARSYKYVEDIFKEWVQQNIKTVEDARLYVKEKNKRKSNIVDFSSKKKANGVDWEGFDLSD